MPSLSRRILFALATSDRFERSVLRVPGGQRWAYGRARRYVAGLVAADAIAAAWELDRDGIKSSIDFFGESITAPDEADRVAEAYVRLARELVEAPAGTYLSLDLSHLGIDQSGDGALRRMVRIVDALPSRCRVQIGAEQASRADAILDVVLRLGRTGGAVTATIQANLRRSRRDAELLAEAGIPIRLVKGAYVEDPAVSLRWGDDTDIAFVELAYALHRGGAELTLGTHDPVLREALLPALPGVGVEMLLGVRSGDARELAARGVPVRVYVPYGDGWFRYAMRRLAESRGA